MARFIKYISSMPQFVISTLIVFLMLFKKLFFFNLEDEYASSVPGMVELVSLAGLAIFGIYAFVKTLHIGQIKWLKKGFFKINILSAILSQYIRKTKYRTNNNYKLNQGNISFIHFIFQVESRSSL